MYFCVPVPEEASPADVSDVQARRTMRKMPDITVPEQVMTHIGYMCEVKQETMRRRRRLVAKHIEFLSDIPENKDDILKKFTFVTPNFVNHVVEKNGIVVEKMNKLMIYFETMCELLGSRSINISTDQRRIILYNMFDRESLIFIIIKKKQIKELVRMIEFRKKQDTPKYELDDDLMVFVYKPCAKFDVSLTQDVLVILPRQTQCQITESKRGYYTAECTNGLQGSFNIDLDYNKLAKKCEIELVDRTFTVACPRAIPMPLDVPFFPSKLSTFLKEPSYISYDALSGTFVDKSLYNFNLIIFGDTFSFFDDNGTWDQELDIIRDMIYMIDKGCILMLSTVYRHTGTNRPLHRLARIINTQKLLTQKDGTPMPVLFHAKVSSPLVSDGSDQCSLIIKKGNVSTAISYTVDSNPRPITTRNQTRITAQWTVHGLKEREETPFSASVESVIKDESEFSTTRLSVKVVDGPTVRSNILTIVYEIDSLEPGQYNISFSISVGENELRPLLSHAGVTVVTATTTADSSSGSSLLFRSGRQLDMMITV